MRIPILVTMLLMLPLLDLRAEVTKISGSRTPIILDTDIGTDIDDAFALALAVSSPELELRGVTTVSADAYTRALIACRFLKTAGLGAVPVAAGRPRRETPETQGQYQYGLRPGRKEPLKISAVDFLYEQVRANPGAITIVCVGDQTNAAELIRRHPDAKPWIKRIVLMGGAIRVGYNGRPPASWEWNIRSDIKAAQTLFRSGVPIVMAPLDATRVRLTEPHRRRILESRSPLAEPLHDLYRLWGKETPVLFDCVAVALAFNESFCTMENLRIEVDDQGVTHEVEGKPNCRAATSIRADDFLEWYVDRIIEFKGLRKPTTRENGQ